MNMRIVETDIPCPYCGGDMLIAIWTYAEGRLSCYPHCEPCSEKIAQGFDSEEEAREFVSRRATTQCGR